jgi:hypothetical protein
LRTIGYSAEINQAILVGYRLPSYICHSVPPRYVCQLQEDNSEGLLDGRLKEIVDEMSADFG